MTRKEAAGVIKFEKACVLRQDTPQCHRDCKKCDLLLPTEDVLTAYDMAIKALEQQPKTGHWIEIAQYSDGKHKIECSECKGHIFSRGHANSFRVKNEYKFCPHCGCRMAEPQESEDKE